MLESGLRKAYNIVPFCLSPDQRDWQNETTIRYWKMQTPRIVLTLPHLGVLHDVLRETFLKVTNNEM